MTEQRIFEWKKLGRVIEPQTNLWWMQSHAMLPTPHLIDDRTVRVYFSGRDRNNVSHIGWALLRIDNEQVETLAYSEEPVLSPGERGCFDDNGVTPSCIVENGEELLLYYIGWNPGFNVRMHLFGGLAVSLNEGATFTRYSRAPILERNRVNPYLNTAPCVLRSGTDWTMYYVSGTEWIHKDLPRYNIQIAHSCNGYDWERRGDIAIDYKDEDEMALARPWVIENSDGTFTMWFGFKGDTTKSENYRIGYATSMDGRLWERADSLARLDVSDSGWDSEMIEYVSVFKMNSKYYALYNGNNYGQTGVGIAIAE